MEPKTYVKMLQLRMDGHTIRNVAEQCDCSYQTVANYLNKLRTDEKRIKAADLQYPALPDPVANRIIEALVLYGDNMDAVCEASGAKEEQVLSVVNYITAKRPATCRNCVYPAVFEWMKKNIVTLRQMSKDTGICLVSLSKYMNGWLRMPPRVAERISKYTGIPVSEIKEDRSDLLLDELKVSQNETEGNHWLEEEIHDPVHLTEMGEVAVVSNVRTRTEFVKPPAKRRD